MILDEPSRSTGSGSSFMDPLETKWQRLMRSRRDDSSTQGLPGGNAPGSGNSPLIRNPTMPVEVDISAQEVRSYFIETNNQKNRIL